MKVSCVSQKLQIGVKDGFRAVLNGISRVTRIFCFM